MKKQYYEGQQKFWLDQNSFVKEAIDDAKKEGELNKQIEIANNAIIKGFDNNLISELTGLEIGQIEQLRAKIL